MEELREEFEQLKATLQLFVKRVPLLEKTYLTAEETAIILGVKARTIREYNKQGKLNGRKYSKGGMLYFATQEVLAFQQDNLRHAAFFDS